MSETRKPSRSWNSPAKRGKTKSTGALLLRLSLGVGFLVCAAGVALILSGKSTMPVFQSFQAAFPEALLGPGEARLLVRLEHPFTHEPLSGTVHVYLEGRLGRRFELGSAPVEGAGTVPLSLPNLGMGGWGLVARVEGAPLVEEISVPNVDITVNDKVQISTERYVYFPGEEVRFLGLARHNDDPPRPAAGEPWVLQVSSPSGELLHTIQGKTGPGGAFQGSFTLPLSARPGFYAVDVRIGRDIFGYTEVKVPDGVDPFRVRPLSGRRPQAGKPFRGKLAVTLPDGTPCSGLPVQVVLFKNGKQVGRTSCVLVGPGIYSFTLDLPPLGPGEEGPMPMDLEARIPDPAGEDQLRLPFQRIFLYQSDLRILLETPHRWVPGMPHRVRAALADGGDHPLPARIEVRASREGRPLASADYPGKGSAVLDFHFPQGTRFLFFSALDGKGRLLARRRIRCKLPERRDQGFSLVLEKSVLAQGEPLRLTVYDRKKTDRLWVDLLVEGMVTRVFPLRVKEGKGNMEIPASKLPRAIFQVRVWRWDGEPVPMHQAECFAPGGGSLAARSRVLPEGKGLKAESGLPPKGELIFAGRPGGIDPYDVAGPERVLLSLFPGTFGFADPDLHRLAAAWRDGLPLPELREDLAPTLKDSWTGGNGPGRLVEARMEQEIGKVVILAGAAAALLGVLISLWVFSREKAARARREARLMVLFLALSLGGLRAQAPPAEGAGPSGGPQGEPPRSRTEPSRPSGGPGQGNEEEGPGEVLPFRLPAWAWQVVPPSREKAPAPLGPFVPELPGKQILTFGGQAPGSGALFFAWREARWAPPLEVRWTSRGTIWPGAVWRLPLWVRPGKEISGGIRPYLSGKKAPVGASVELRGAGTWRRVTAAYSYEDALAGRRLRILDGAGKVLAEAAPPFSPPAKEERLLSWSAPFEEGLSRELSFGPGILERKGLVLLAFSHPVEMALEHLDRVQGDPLAAGSLDQVLGRARTALAVLEVLRKSRSFSPEVRNRAAVRALGHLMEAWREMAGFRNVIGGFADFPRGVDEISPTAEALAFLGKAKAYLPLGKKGLLRRLRRWLWAKVRDDGRVMPDPGFLAEELWRETGGGGVFITAQVERALAAAKAEIYYLKRTEDVIRVDLKDELPPFVRIEAVRALLARDPKNPAGLQVLKKCLLFAGDRSVGVRAGFTDWTGAEGARADLTASARLATALARAGLAPEKAEILRKYILDRIRPDLGFGDEWTTGACYEALLAAPEALEPGGGMEVLVRVDGKGGARKKGGPFLEIPLDPPAGKKARIQVETRGKAPLGAVVLTGRRLLEPGRAFRKGPLLLNLAPRPGAGPPSLETPLSCVLTVGNTFSRSLARVVVRIPRTAAVSLLPGGLFRAVRQGEAARVLVGKKATLVWFTHFPQVFTRKIRVDFVPHAGERIHLPPVRAWVFFQEDLEVRTAPLEVVVGS